MISYAELDRALARWKARQQGSAVAGGVIDAGEPGGPVEEVSEATPMPIPAEELGSIPNSAAPLAPEGTGEIDASELEAYEEELDQK
jgi:hypothetical protein